MTRERTQQEWLSDLESDDAAAVISALHRACPCSGSPELYETFMSTLLRFKKDPRADVRRVALHLEIDALDELKKADEIAAGRQRNRPGGNDGARADHKAELRPHR